MNMPIPKRNSGRQSRESRMCQIEAAARNVFAQKGYTATSMAEIAAKAGIAEGTIYRYYENKRVLLLAVLDSWYEGMYAKNIEKISGIEGTRARFQALIWQHLESIHVNPDLCRLFFSEVRSSPDYRHSKLHFLNRSITNVLMDIVKEGIDKKEFRADISITLVRDLTFGGIEHHVSSFLAHHGDLDHDDVARQLTDIVMSGIRNPETAVDSISEVVGRLEKVSARLDAQVD